jgi:hypothetical protein
VHYFHWVIFPKKLRVEFLPHPVAGRAGSDEDFGPGFFDRSDVFLGYLQGQLHLTVYEEGIAAAEFLFAQYRIVDPTLFQDVNHALGQAIGLGVKGRYAAHKVDKIGFAVAANGEVQVLSPGEAQGFVLSGDVAGGNYPGA